MEIYSHAKFRWDKSIEDSDKTTSGFWKQTAATVEFHFRFRYRSRCSHRRVILHPPVKFRSNRSIVRVMTSYPFISRWQSAAMLDLMWVMSDNPRSATVGISSVLRLGLDPIYSFGDIAIFIFCCFFAWNCLFTPFFSRGVGGIPPNMLTHRSNRQKDHPCAETRRLSHKARRSIQRFDLGAGSRKKVRTGQDSQKSHKVVIFRLFGEKPPLHRLKPKFAWLVNSPTQSRVQGFIIFSEFTILRLVAELWRHIEL